MRLIKLDALGEIYVNVDKIEALRQEEKCTVVALTNGNNNNYIRVKDELAKSEVAIPKKYCVLDSTAGYLKVEHGYIYIKAYLCLLGYLRSFCMTPPALSVPFLPFEHFGCCCRQID